MEVKFKDRALPMKVRQWSIDAGITTAEGQFKSTVEECCEWEKARLRRDRLEMMDALGDKGVVSIVQYKLAAEELGLNPNIESNSTEDDPFENQWTGLGDIAEGVRKSRPEQVMKGALRVWHEIQNLCVLHGFEFEECLEYVYSTHLVKRLDKGEIRNGSFIKKEDQGEEE